MRVLRRRGKDAGGLLYGLLEFLVAHQVSVDLVDLQVDQHTCDLWRDITALEIRDEFKDCVAEHVLQNRVLFLHRGQDLLRRHHILTSFALINRRLLLELLVLSGRHHLVGLRLRLRLLLLILVVVVLWLVLVVVLVVVLVGLALLVVVVALVVVRFPLLVRLLLVPLVVLLPLVLVVVVVLVLLVVVVHLLHGLLHGKGLQELSHLENDLFGRVLRPLGRSVIGVVRLFESLEVQLVLGFLADERTVLLELIVGHLQHAVVDEGVVEARERTLRLIGGLEADEGVGFLLHAIGEEFDRLDVAELSENLGHVFLGDQGVKVLHVERAPLAGILLPHDLLTSLSLGQRRLHEQFHVVGGSEVFSVKSFDCVVGASGSFFSLDKSHERELSFGIILLRNSIHFAVGDEQFA